MKHNILFRSAVAMLVAGAAMTACTDNIAVGDASLDKATSSTATIDSVFQNAEYTRQFLIGIYSKQYYGLPYANGGAYMPHAGNPYTGKFDGLTDCWHQFWNGAAVYGQYYTGAMTATTNRSDGLDGPLYSYDKEFQWYTIRASHIFLENVDRAPEVDMKSDEKNRLKAEARCLMVSAFFETFQHFGGIPIMDHALTTDEVANETPRDSVEVCVDWMVNELDKAIADNDFPWITSNPATMNGRWTKAGAMALKCKILQFAASPLLNPKDGQPYYSGASEEQKPFIMYTDASKYQERWDRFAKACDDFYNALQANGQYSMVLANIPSSATTAAKKAPYYRLAYRQGYFLNASPEILHSVRVYGNDPMSTARYGWHEWYSKAVPRNAYCPTQEYVEKFSWNDGEPFNWTNAAKKTYKSSATEPDVTVTKADDGSEVYTVSNFVTNTITGAITRNPKSLHTMFVSGDVPAGGRQITTSLTRDPRLYEECIVNGLNMNLDWSTASMTGDPWELWYDGNDGGTGVLTQQNTMFGSGYGFNKYYLGTGVYSGDQKADSYRYPTQWVALSLPEFYLQYAEALVMRSNPDVTKAAQMINIVRSRVGLPGVETMWTRSNFRSAKGYKATTLAAAATTPVTLENGETSTEFMEELLDERVRELGLTNARWFDMVRYKRTDWMTKQLHGLMQYRLIQKGSVFVSRNVAWIGADHDNDPSSTQPLFFLNSIKTITGNSRYLWNKDPKSNEVKKWLLDPLPQAEINKHYGLVQNPGWE
ncbi:RagB/SusD family nutrient uptake outer membrane protein [Segatella baroniae]|uniref:RagB/SusD family nutrient uptake outer membrane protein n=1 Tax=Segatella baroniae TaxID=305719 RepID=UPI00040686FD|nr:RagB/SusD family nutrient uptake outer membrane protein [Segatella baroniae]